MTRRIALTSRFGWRLLILGAVGVLVFGAGDAAISAPREGVDCGCEEVGLYENPEPGKVPAKVITSDSGGTSPDGTYLYTVGKQGTQIFLTVTDANSNVGLNLKKSLRKYFDYYNNYRPHSSLDYRTPAEAYFAGRDSLCSASASPSLRKAKEQDKSLQFTPYTEAKMVLTMGRG